MKDLVLRENLNKTFEHILELSSLSESPDYKGTAGSFRKTIIIYTASVIEALLLYYLRGKIKRESVEIEDKWKYKDVKKIHELESSPLQEIIWCIRMKEVKTLEKLNLGDINRLCFRYDVIKDSIFKNCEKVRKLRNRLHVGGLKEVEKDYTKKDLEFVFSVAKEIKDIGKNF